MVSILEDPHKFDAYAERDVYTLLLQLTHCESKRYMRSKHAHEELLTLLITVVVLIAILLFIVIWKLC